MRIWTAEMQEGVSTVKPSAAKWCFWHIREAETLWTITDEELDREAARFAANGFTHLMTFMVHFRISYRRDWNTFTDLLSRMVKAAHRYGLKLVEHHSAVLLWCFANSEGRQRARGENPEKDFPHLEADCDLESEWDGIQLKELLQISGVDGKPVTTFMNSWICCHNNPDYRKRYFKYLEQLYAVGIDGIMTDDIQFCSAPLKEGEDFDMDSCACPHCRRLFREQTGYELPPPGDAWREFQENRESARFIAWKNFRRESVMQFYADVDRHYQQMGLKMLRPNYASTAVSWHSPWGYAVSGLATLDWIFVENCCGFLRYSWPEFLVESCYAAMLSRQRHIPGMALYYPETTEQQRLAWALSLYSGLRFFTDPRRKKLFPEQREFHRFEDKYFDRLFDCNAIADIAIMDSVRGREAQADYNSTTRFRFNSIVQSCIFNNIAIAIVRPEHAEEYRNYQLLIIPGTVYMSDEQIADVGKYAGKVLWCDNAGRRRMDGTERTEAEILSLLGIQAFGGRVEQLKNGEFSAPFYRRCRADGIGNRDAFNCSEPERWRLWSEEEKESSRKLADKISSLYSAPSYIIEGAPENVLLSAFRCCNGHISLRLVNASGTLRAPELPGYGAVDPVEFPLLPDDAVIYLRVSGVRKVSWAALPAASGELSFTDNGNESIITLPAGLLQNFLLITVEF